MTASGAASTFCASFAPRTGRSATRRLRAAPACLPTVSRLTYTLTQLGYLNYDRKLGVYSLGGGVLALGYVALAHLDVRRVARPLMQDLADECGASVGLGARDRLNMLGVENCEGARTSSPCA